MLPRDSRSWHYGYRTSGASWNSSDLSAYLAANPQLGASQRSRTLTISRKLEVGAPLPHAAGWWVVLRKLNQFCIDTGRPEILSPPPTAGNAAGMDPRPLFDDFARWCGTLNAASTVEVTLRHTQKAFLSLGWKIPRDLGEILDRNFTLGRLSALRAFGFYLRNEKALESVLVSIPMKRSQRANIQRESPAAVVWRPDEEVAAIMRAASEASRGSWWAGAEDEIQAGAILMAKSKGPLMDHERLVAIFRWRAMRNAKRKSPTAVDERYELEGQAPKGRGRVDPNQVLRVMVRESIDRTRDLPHEQRVAVLLCAMGFTHGETAVLVDSTVTAVCRRIANARAKLREWTKWNTRDYSKIQDNSSNF